ncbi:glycosyltransferase [Lentzea cavernae]|uniref:Glycosyl transferase n=1 Tax=Lentzea cavernae TaxID=2020703 RepID=A0ABQ3MTX4_9PSEU|nr:glycosyltransferase [Lentzea cavernae]GHH59780.1 glycosyl transferase [Lentzea cavernae]
MRTISVITPIYNPQPEYLLAAHESLQAQKLPPGWTWEWLVQEDGNTDVAEVLLPLDDRIKHGTGRHGGVAITRNLALSRASGELVKNLDQDDLLTAGVLARDIAALTENDGVHWTTSRVLDLMPDGKLVGFDNDPKHGVLEPGDVLKHWQEHNFRLPVHPTTLCIRRDLAVMLGGWMAVPGSDDTGLLVAASVLANGFFDETVGLHYRKWPGQESAAGSKHYEAVEWTARMNLINERAKALQNLWSTVAGRWMLTP